MTLSTSILIPVRNEGARFLELVRSLERLVARSPGACEVVVADTESTDGSREAALAAGFRVLDVKRGEFGHGRTRNRLAAEARGRRVVYLVGDALPLGEDWLRTLAEALDRGGHAGVFGRQRARPEGASEAFFVAWNYPAEGYVVRPGDRLRPGRMIFSNVFSMIEREVLERHPFPENAVMSEDQIWAARVLAAGHTLAYVPEAVCLHAHDYTLGQLFRRNFDSGASLQDEALVGGGFWRSAARYLGALCSGRRREGGGPGLPRALAYEGLRVLGFQLGRVSRRLPAALRRRFHLYNDPAAATPPGAQASR